MISLRSLKLASIYLNQRSFKASISKNKLENLKPNDILKVYHGTSLQQAYFLVNGFDANTTHSRLYGGPRHSGLFISPNIELAERFSHYGEIILEILVRAKNLHGVDYSGNIGRVQDMNQTTKNWIRNSYPNSFRPYLSMTMLQKNEPQALLRGLIKPNQILRIRYKKYRERPIWYSRKEFLNLNLKTVPGGGYGSEKEIKDLKVDLSYPKYSIEEFISHISRLSKKPENRVRHYLKLITKKGYEPTLNFIQRFGFGITASKMLTQKLIKYFN